MQIVEISVAETYPLRRAVLRDNDPSRAVTFAEDDAPGTFHLGARNEAGRIVAVSTWVPRECAEFPGRRAIQLRGMATEPALQGTGIGGAMLEHGASRCAAEGFDLLWARARDSALRFYERHGCRVVGEGFIDTATDLPHHIVVRDLI
jgi:GNAT superfamily N-acetyltransferase